MSLFVFGLVLFLGVHSVRIVADSWRQRTLSRIGAGAWRAGYALIALTGFVLLVMGWDQVRMAPQILWVAPEGMKHLAGLVTVFAFILLTAAYVPANAIKAAVGHPMVAGVILWSLVHLLASGTLAGTILFGSFLVWSVLDFMAARRRDRRDGVTYARGPAVRTFITVMLGLVSWGLFAFWLHAWLIDIAPLGQP